MDVPPDGHGLGTLHATMGGRCVIVPYDPFYAWAVGLVGVTVAGEPQPGSTQRHWGSQVLDFDQIETSKASRTLGLRVCRTNGQDWETVHEVTLSAGEFWDALVELAGTDR